MRTGRLTPDRAAGCGASAGALITGTEVALAWVGDGALRLSFGEAPDDAARERVRAAFQAVREAGIPSLESIVPAQATLLLEFDAARLDPIAAESAVRRALSGARAAAIPAPRRIEIPVCYEPPYALDIDSVASLAHRSAEEVVRLHAQAEYTVRFLGFSPGFPYLDGLDPALAVPRLERPRPRVPEGSVAIAAGQAGIYPLSTPGGWRILGRTQLRLFDPARDEPALLGLGDRVRFVPIPRAEFERLAAEVPP